ncbi:hypothetical protein MBANPS3_003348 [Mucor bainieri]
MVQVALNSLVTVVAAVGMANCLAINKHELKHEVKHAHKRAAPQGKAFDHILQVWFENQDYSTIAKTAGFTNLLKEGILLTNFNAVTHPSEPNYVAAAGGDNFGINNDDYYNIPANISSIFDLLENKGLTWKVYQEDIPSVGYTGYKAGNYVRKHNPAVIFDSVGLNATRSKNIVGADQFTKDITANSLPNWMFYTPNMLNDGHDTSASYAGNWLTTFYKNTLSNSNLLSKTLILITFDENASSSKRNQVWSLLLGNIPANLKGTTDSTFYTHFSSLSTVEHNWDLGNLGRQDTNKNLANVYSYAASALGYTNVAVTNIPNSNAKITGLLTGKSYNQTH